MSTLYEETGDVFFAVAEALHARCLADPELNHPFSHADQNPEHVTRLGWYLAEACGGPARYTAAGGGHSTVLQMHAGNGDMSDLGDRFVACFAGALADVGLAQDLHEPLVRCMRQATDESVSYPGSSDDVPAGLPMPRWTRDGIA